MTEITVISDVNFSPAIVDLNKAIEYGLNSRMELCQREIEIENSRFSLIKTKSSN